MCEGLVEKVRYPSRDQPSLWCHSLRFSQEECPTSGMSPSVSTICSFVYVITLQSTLFPTLLLFHPLLRPLLISFDEFISSAQLESKCHSYVTGLLRRVPSRLHLGDQPFGTV